MVLQKNLINKLLYIQKIYKKIRNVKVKKNYKILIIFLNYKKLKKNYKHTILKIFIQKIIIINLIKKID